jgi:hypothetical protein
MRKRELKTRWIESQNWSVQSLWQLLLLFLSSKSMESITFFRSKLTNACRDSSGLGKYGDCFLLPPMLDIVAALSIELQW